MDGIQYQTPDSNNNLHLEENSLPLSQQAADHFLYILITCTWGKGSMRDMLSIMQKDIAGLLCLQRLLMENWEKQIRTRSSTSLFSVCLSTHWKLNVPIWGAHKKCSVLVILTWAPRFPFTRRGMSVCDHLEFAQGSTWDRSAEKLTVDSLLWINWRMFQARSLWLRTMCNEGTVYQPI